MSFIVKVTYESPKYLHLRHHTIKTKEFILGSTESKTLQEARKHQYTYVEDFYNMITSVIYKNQKEIPIEPLSQAELAIQNDYFSTEEPCSWKINIWQKITHPGYIYNSYSKVKLLSVEVMEMQYNDDESEEDTITHNGEKIEMIPFRASKSVNPLFKIELDEKLKTRRAIIDNWKSLPILPQCDTNAFSEESTDEYYDSV